MRTALPLGPNDALLLGSFRFVHAFGAAEAVEVVLLDRRWRIVEIGRIEPSAACFFLRGVSALVVAAGVTERLVLAPGQVLEFGEERVPDGRASAD